MAAPFPLNGIEAVVEWTFAKIPARFPGLKIVLSEAGVSWVPMAIERVRRGHRQLPSSLMMRWADDEADPVELMQRCFYYTSIEDPSAFRMLDLIGEDRVMLEVDYPHGDSSWPDTQELHPRRARRPPCRAGAQALFRKRCVRLPPSGSTGTCGCGRPLTLRRRPHGLHRVTDTAARWAPARGLGSPRHCGIVRGNPTRKESV